MKLQRFYFSGLLLILPFLIFAQKNPLTLSDAILGGSSKFGLTSWSGMQWDKNKNILYYHKRGAWLYKLNAATNKLDSVELVSKLNKLIPNLNKPLTAMPSMKQVDNDRFSFETGNVHYVYDLVQNKFITSWNIPTDHLSLELNEATGNMAYTFKNGLYIRSMGQDRLIIQGSDSIVYGESVHRQEFGINKGLFWSNDGQSLAFYRMDQTMVTQYPILVLSDTPAMDRKIFYPMAGDRSHHVTLGIYNVQTQKITWLQTGGDPEHYLTNICWSPDGKLIYIAEVNRDQNHTWFNAYDPTSGAKVLTLYEEQSTQYTEPLEPFTFIPQNSDLFIAQSKRDGWNSLYLYNTSGQLQRQLTRELEVTSISNFDKDNKVVYFQAIPPASIDLQFYRTDLATGKTIQLTSGGGAHTGFASADGKYLLEQAISINQPLTYTLKNLKSGKSRVLLISPEPLDLYNLGRTVIDTLSASDGSRLFTRTIFPADFNPTKKYPAVIYVYGGPHAQMIKNTRLAQAQLWMYVMANEGFIVYTLDNRGSGNRGMNFEDATFRQLGTIEMQDQMVGYNSLASKPYVDPARIGVHGWSFGGFMTISLMTRQPGKFKAAVAGGPVTNWRYYEIMYTERYMDTPQQNPEGFATANTFNYIDNLDGPMLLIHGTSDDVVVWQQSLNYIKACVDKGKQVDYFVYPGHPHNVGGKDRIHLIRKIIDYFELHL
ncbi:MAG TPA: DPP IV N-terminal domain-containing protein [Saprospiraceae bacterium]|nr:DPP IV N-terminal domain-containing protein [Saprospiraceae bacterium]